MQTNGVRNALTEAESAIKALYSAHGAWRAAIEAGCFDEERQGPWIASHVAIAEPVESTRGEAFVKRLASTVEHRLKVNLAPGIPAALEASVEDVEESALRSIRNVIASAGRMIGEATTELAEIQNRITARRESFTLKATKGGAR